MRELLGLVEAESMVVATIKLTNDGDAARSSGSDWTSPFQGEPENSCPAVRFDHGHWAEDFTTQGILLSSC